MEQRVRRMAWVVWVGLAGLLAVAMLSACGDGSTATPAALPTAVPAPATSTATPTPVPPTSTPTPTLAPTAEPGVGPVGGDFGIDDIDSDTLWGDLFDAFTADEQSCIRTELGDELLESAFAMRVLAEGDTEEWMVSTFGCLAPETAAAIFFTASTMDMEGLTEDQETCIREKLTGIDVADILASTLPDADPDSTAAADAFGLGLLSCLVGLSDFPQVVPPGLPDAPALWSLYTGGWIVNAPTVADGVVYFGSDDDSVNAVDASTGDPLWRFEVGEVVRSTPTVTGGAVYVGSNDNHVYALDAETGELLWKYDTGDWAQYSPTVSDGKVYLGAQTVGGHRIHALDAASGEVAWVAEPTYPFRPEFTPTVVGDKVYTPGDSFRFHALDASTGEVVWSFETGIGGEAPPTVVGGVVYLTGVNAAYALDESTGEVLWSYDTERLPAREFPAIIADGIYYFAPDNNVYALDVATGEPLWSYEFSAADGMVDGTPVVADGVVYVGLEFGSFHALQAGSVLWSRESGDVRLDSPVVADSVLYAESSDGFLRALDAATGEELWTFQKGYFSGVRSFTVTDGVVYVGALDGGMHAFPAPEVEEVLTLLYWQAPSLPGPYLSGGFKDRDAGAVTLEPLAVYNPDGDLLPALAVDIPTIENGGISQDLMSITWTLKEGLQWSDGSDVTADDVVFTWRYCVDEETGCTAVDAFNGIASVEAPDARTVKITFDAPTPYPYSAFVSAGTPIISQAQFADCVGAAASSCAAQNTAPLGTGPYRIVSFEIDQEAVYERNPFYRGPAPYFDRVVLNGGGDAVSAARAVLETGEADYASNLQVTPETLAGMEAAGRGTVVSAFASLVERIVVNQTNPDPALGENRSEYLGGQNPHPFLTFAPIPQAMSMAIDRGLITERLYGFAGEPTCNLVAGPSSYVSTANDGCLSQDVEGANRLLDENGVLDTDGDGVREYSGTPLRITYQTSANAVREDTQALIRDWWREIGIETELIQHDASVFFGGDPIADADASYRRFFADVQMYATGPDIDPQQYLSGLRCSHIATRDNNWADGNVARSCNPEYDRLYKELAQTGAGPERAALVKQLNDILVQNYFEIPLVNRGFVSAHLNTLQGVWINAWDTELWNIAEWRR